MRNLHLHDESAALLGERSTENEKEKRLYFIHLYSVHQLSLTGPPQHHVP